MGILKLNRDDNLDTYTYHSGGQSLSRYLQPLLSSEAGGCFPECELQSIKTPDQLPAIISQQREHFYLGSERHLAL